MLPIKPEITTEKIQSMFFYVASSGELFWAISQGSVKAGTIVTGDYVKINAKSYVTARVIWCIHYNEWPPENLIVEHRNRIHGDNRIENLRLATYTQNAQNKAGYAGLPKGVYKRNRISLPWAARIHINGIPKELGSYATMEEAAKAYQQAALEHHGEFACYD